MGRGGPSYVNPAPGACETSSKGENPTAPCTCPPPEVHHKRRARLAGGIHRGFPLPALLPAALVHGEGDKAVSLKGVMLRDRGRGRGRGIILALPCRADLK